MYIRIYARICAFICMYVCIYIMKHMHAITYIACCHHLLMLVVLALEYCEPLAILSSCVSSNSFRLGKSVLKHSY